MSKPQSQGINMNDNISHTELNQANASFITKIDHYKDFTTIDNKTIHDKKISLKATGLLCLLLTFPPNWKVNIKHLSNLKEDGRESITSAMNELKEAGYVYMHQPRNDKGQMLPVQYFVSEFPKAEEEFKKCLPQTDFPQTAFPLTGNPPILNTNIYTNTNNNKCPDSSESLGSDDPHICSKYLFEKLKTVKENAKEPKWSVWDKTFEKMIRIDKIPKEKIIEAIDFVYRPRSTWAIQCAESLRSKYDRIDFHLQKEAKNKISQVNNINNNEDKKIMSVISLVNYWLTNITKDPIKINMGTLKIENNTLIGPCGKFFKKTFAELMRIVKEEYKAPDGLIKEIYSKCNNINNITNVYKQKIS